MQTKQMLVSDRLAMNPKYVTDLYKDGLTLRITIALLSGMLATTAPAAPGTLANSPLYLVQKTIPNIFFEVDDSGSMDWEILTKKHWEPCAYDANYPALIGDNDCGAGEAVFEGMLQSLPGPDGGAAYPLPYSEFPYIYNNADNIYNPYGSGCTGTWNTGPVYTPNLESCPPDSRYYEWRAYTPAVNVLYYNPAITYKPWQNGDGTSMPDADFTQARSNPRDTQTGYNQIRNLVGFVYEEWHDSHGFSGTRPQRGSNINRTVGANGIVDFWDEHTRYIVNANDITVESIGYTPDGTGKLQPTVTSTTTVTDAATLVEVKQNIANWYQYYRRRSFVAKAAIAKVIDDNPSFRYGFNVINASTPFVEVPSVADLPPFITHNTGLLQSFFEYKWQPIGTPLRGGLNRAGEYFENTDSKTAPIVEACQQNYTILVTDGYWNDPDPLPAKIADNDGDGISQTLADVSQYYYSKDLSPLNNQVVTTDFDQADWQHMVTYTIAFGLHGLLVDDDNDSWPGTAPGLLENGLWGNPFNGKSRPEKIDDLWHAAYNGRGQFIAASSPEEISKALQDALASIGKEYSTSAAVAFNSGSLQNSTALYQVKFKNFTGDLEAYPYDAALKDFSGSPKWSAAGLLNSLPSPQTSRTIITRNDSQGVAFDWLGLSANQKADLLVDPNGATGSATKAQARVDYIRGDKSNEVGGGFDFRKRDSLLGDIINSIPVSVGKPKATWPNAAPFPTTAGQTYSDFSLAQASRPEMVYVGANDGMLHGFKGADGTEAIAYIPKAVFSATKGSGLHYLTDSNYSHRYYVDMPSVVEDAYFNAGPGSAWHSVLIGGTRSGGKGIFALDVTNPAAFSEANAASIALWEFNSSDDADMGYSFSIPTIAMLNNKRWAAIFGNGYNNNGDGKAKLFILFLDGGLDGIWTAGSDYIELSTNAGSIVAPKNCADPLSDCNGLSTPQTVDTNNDQLVDRVYAGDLKGNLWAFDLSSADAASWGVAYSGSPLFVAANQPITTKPAVVRHPTELNGAVPNVMVFFGTGQYLATADINSAATQGFYGVWDNGSASLTSANLVEQTFFTFTDKAGNTVDAQSTLRVLSDNPVDYSVKHGWYIQFKNGERITTDALIYEEVVLFNTRLPSSTACTSGGNGSRIFVPQATGGRSTFNIFDANKDKVVSAADFLQDASDSNYAVNSVAVKDTFPEQSSVIGNVLVTPLTNMSRLLDILYVPNQGSMKRISWQELQKE